jgi:hypothetical protein
VRSTRAPAGEIENYLFIRKGKIPYCILLQTLLNARQQTPTHAPLAGCKTQAS